LFGGYGLALAALALVVFGAIGDPPFSITLPSTAQRCRRETEKNIIEDLFSSVLSLFKE